MYQLVKMKLRNNRASGEDRITGELIKYGPDIVKEKLCNTYNKMFENHYDEINRQVKLTSTTKTKQRKRTAKKS